MIDKNDYLEMQRRFYEQEAAKWNLENRDPVVGSYDSHNDFADYDKILFDGLDCSNKIALEYGCGPGRNLVKFAHIFDRIDGTDISQVNLDKAAINLAAHDVNKDAILKVTSGDNVPFEDNTYDVVFSVICLQHIPVHEIRYAIMSDIFRVLKPGSHFCFQMGYGGRSIASSYYENVYEAQETNGGYDVSLESVDPLVDDLQKIGYVDIRYTISDMGPGDSHPNWLWVIASKP